MRFSFLKPPPTSQTAEALVRDKEFDSSRGACRPWVLRSVERERNTHWAGWRQLSVHGGLVLWPCMLAGCQLEPALWLRAKWKTAAIPMRQEPLSKAAGSDQAGQPLSPRVERVGPVAGFSGKVMRKK